MLFNVVGRQEGHNVREEFFRGLLSALLGVGQVDVSMRTWLAVAWGAAAAVGCAESEAKLLWSGGVGVGDSWRMYFVVG